MAEEYGVTPSGVNIKRLDVIVREMHKQLSDGWGVNTQMNPSSFLNVLVTDIADKIAELWEFGAGIYYAMYPSSAEGTNLDYAAQFGGVIRELSAKSYYPVHCKGIDGTVLPGGTRLGTSTNPKKYFTILNPGTITRARFNEAAISVSASATGYYSISINGTVYGYTAGSGANVKTILTGLVTALNASVVFTSGFKCKYLIDGAEYESITDVTLPQELEKNCIHITAIDSDSTNELVLSDNLTTQFVATILTFASEEAGNIVQPERTITEIVTSVAGWTEAWNEPNYTAGRLRQTDVEFRNSYIKKIFGMSSRMCDSIVSALLKLQGVTSASAYENYTNYTTLEHRCDGTETGPFYILHEGVYYSFSVPSIQNGDHLSFSTESKKITKNGTTEISPASMSVTKPQSGTDMTNDFESEIYPHAVEVVVDGGNESDIAKAILETKSAGINTYGKIEVEVPDAYDNTITIRFNRPIPVYVFFKVVVTRNLSEAIPPNYTQIIEDVILSKMQDFAAGDDVTPQQWMTDIYKACTGISYLDITLAVMSDQSETPSAGDFVYRSVPISKREKAITDADRIEVSIGV